MSNKSFVLVSLLLLSAAFATTLQAQQIGPGSGISGATGVDGAGGRTNISDNNATAGTLLAANTYRVLDFEYNSQGGATGAGDTVRPFLARLVSGDTWQPIWIGPAQTPPAAAGIVTVPYTSELFTLATNTVVYAGFTQTGNALVRHNSSGTTDHNTSAISPPALNLLTPFTMTNNQLARTYAYEINVQAVPEPASVAIWSVLGLSGLVFAFWRHKRSGK